MGPRASPRTCSDQSTRNRPRRRASKELSPSSRGEGVCAKQHPRAQAFACFLKEGRDRPHGRPHPRRSAAGPAAMNNGMAAGSGRGEGEERKEPSMIPFLSACFTELRAKGVCVCVCVCVRAMIFFVTRERERGSSFAHSRRLPQTLERGRNHHARRRHP